MKKSVEFLQWLVFKNPISLVYYVFITSFLLVTFNQKQSIIDNNNEVVFNGLILFLTVCFVLFTLFSVIPEFKRRNNG